MRTAYLLLSALLAAPAFAEPVKLSLDLGVQYDQVDEYLVGNNGQLRRAVRETGARPVMAVRLDSTRDGVSGHIEARISDGRLTYAGQTNLGGKFNTGTDYRETSLDLGAALAFSPATLRAGLLHEWRDRDIHGRGAVAGLSERYQQGWLYAGAGIDVAAWHLSLDAMLGVYGNQIIRFENTHDPAELPIGDAWGLKLAIERDLPPHLPGRIALELRHMHTGVSERRGLTIQGAPTPSTVYQPEMRRSAVNLRYRLSW